MAHIEIFNSLGQIDLSRVGDEAFAACDDAQKVALVTLFGAVEARKTAEARKMAAVKRVREAMAAEEECQAAAIAVSPAPTFLQIHAANAAAYNKAR